MAKKLMKRKQQPTRRHGLRSAHKRLGDAPGTLTAIPGALPSQIQLIAYDETQLVEKEITDLAEVKSLVGKWPVLWLNVVGLGSLKIIEAIGKLFALHRLALEDVLNLHQRPKVEQYENQFFAVARLFSLNETALCSEQLSIFFGKGFVVTFEERPGDCFELVRQRIRDGKRRLLACGSDYLAYALLDALVDSYFPILERYGDRLEELEELVMDHVDRQHMRAIRSVKRDLLLLRRSLWPLREALATLQRVETDLIDQDTQLYLRDCYDHTVQLIDVLENFRELAGSLLDIYLSSVANRTAEVGKVLTIVATIFIPLGFIAGLYGMNFNTAKSPWNMPELDWAWGYPFALSLMALIAIGMVIFFHHKGWLGDRSDRQ